jgi:hypothetical protein
VSARYRKLAAHIRRLSDDELNDLLVLLPPGRFAALVDAALAWPVRADGLLRFRRAIRQPGELSRWTVHATDAHGRHVLIGHVSQATYAGLGAPTTWRAYTRCGQPLGRTRRPGATDREPTWWERRRDAAAALAWASPASGARCLALAGHVRQLDDLELNDLLVELPVERFDALLDAAFPPKGVAA